ncbi:GTP-binding protein, partial [Zoogloea sp.]|uniref:GTP-binding protein n=1 Tax=Zoogloea sp. TaxID=49181 RepID=UPI00322072A9
LLLRHGNDLLRYKGQLAIRGEARRLILQGVHRITGLDYGRPWRSDEARATTLVLIGRQLDAAALATAFRLACR